MISSAGSYMSALAFAYFIVITIIDLTAIHNVITRAVPDDFEFTYKTPAAKALAEQHLADPQHSGCNQFSPQDPQFTTMIIRLEEEHAAAEAKKAQQNFLLHI